MKQQQQAVKEKERLVSDVLQDGQWRGAPCFIIGGGHSLRGFDFKSLRHLAAQPKILGTNAAWIMEPDVVFITDHRVVRDAMLRRQEQWSSTKVLKLLHRCCASQPDMKDLQDVYFVPVSSSREWGITLAGGVGADSGIRGMNNSGVMALNLADILGADPIYLLGFDMCGIEGRTTNWHTEYKDNWIQRDDVYDRFLASFREFAKPHCNSTVFNCERGVKSRLDCFEKISVLEAIRRCQITSLGT